MTQICCNFNLAVFEMTKWLQMRLFAHGDVLFHGVGANLSGSIFFTSDSLIAFIVEVLQQLLILLLKIVDDLVLLF